MNDLYLNGEFNNFKHTHRPVNAHVVYDKGFMSGKIIYEFCHIADVLVVQELTDSNFTPCFNKKFFKLLIYIFN